MKYQHIVTGTFLRRPNRFIAHALVDGNEVVCHVKNTGRCRELLIPGATLVLEHHLNAFEKGRKTAYSVIGVYKDHGLDGSQSVLINMDSQAPNQVAWEWIVGQEGVTDVRREVTYGKSRFDLAFFHCGKPAFMEVKGVTLEVDGVAMFPDAPTERGVKHLMELKKAVSDGFEAYVLFVIQMEGATLFTPNMATHPAFGLALSDAAAHGVEVLARSCHVEPDSLTITGPVAVKQAQTGNSRHN